MASTLDSKLDAQAAGNESGDLRPPRFHQYTPCWGVLQLRSDRDKDTETPKGEEALAPQPSDQMKPCRAMGGEWHAAGDEGRDELQGGAPS
jgi:hypothetical protein